MRLGMIVRIGAEVFEVFGCCNDAGGLSDIDHHLRTCSRLVVQ